MNVKELGRVGVCMHQSRLVADWYNWSIQPLQTVTTHTAQTLPCPCLRPGPLMFDLEDYKPFWDVTCCILPVCFGCPYQKDKALKQHCSRVSEPDSTRKFWFCDEAWTVTHRILRHKPRPGEIPAMWQLDVLFIVSWWCSALSQIRLLQWLGLLPCEGNKNREREGVRDRL